MSRMRTAAVREGLSSQSRAGMRCLCASPLTPVSSPAFDSCPPFPDVGPGTDPDVDDDEVVLEDGECGDHEPEPRDAVRNESPSKRRCLTSRASARSRHALHAVRSDRREGGDEVAKIWSMMCGKASWASGAEAGAMAACDGGRGSG